MDFSAKWMYAFAIIGGLVAAWRIWQNLQKLRQRQNDSWDARLIDQLRKRGSDPFKPHDVDFFLAFPTSEAAEQLAAQLRRELLGRLTGGEREEEIHVVRLERVGAALAQLVDEARVPRVVLPLPQLLQVLPNAPGRDQAANDGEGVHPLGGKIHAVTRPRRWSP